MKKIIVLAFGAVALLSSCKKDSTSNNCDKTMANLAGTYSIVKLEASFAGGPFTDVTTSELELCQRDDKLILNANGTLSYSDTGTKCDPDGSDTGTWSVSSGGKMTISGTGSTDVSDADISSFDCTTLVLAGTQSVLGTTIQFRITVKK